MAQLTLLVNAKPYIVGCDDGQEAHVQSLGDLVDAKVKTLGTGDPGLGETRTMLMAALMLADELTESAVTLTKSQAHVARLTDLLDKAEAKAVAALDAAAQKIEAMAGR